MKKIHTRMLDSALSLVVLALLAAAPVPLLANQSDASSKRAAKFFTLVGTIAPDGRSFICDKGNRTWTIINPDSLRAFAGQHATLRARLDSVARELTVASAKLTRDERHAPRLDDAAFRK